MKALSLIVKKYGKGSSFYKCRSKVMVKVTLSLTLVSFERVSLAEYTYKI